MVKIVAVDHDGVLIESFRGNPAIAALKAFFFRFFRLFYWVGEVMEVCLGLRWKVCIGAEQLLCDAVSSGLAVGIITDRSLFSLVISAHRAGLDLGLLCFIHARSSCFNRFVRHLVPCAITVMTTPYFKGDKRVLAGLVDFCALLGAKPAEVFFVGDDERDRIAAEQCGFWFAHVDRTRPDFTKVRRALEKIM